MKVIFLDIDGVLNTEETFDRIKREYNKTGILDVEIDRFRVEYLKRIVDATFAKIVLDSSWRSYFIKNGNKIIPKYGSRQAISLVQILDEFGLSLFDMTPKDEFNIRENEIKAWLSEHNDVDNFVIIDDETTFLMSFVNKNLVVTNNIAIGQMVISMEQCTGICEEHVEQAISILNARKVVKKYIKNR